VPVTLSVETTPSCRGRGALVVRRTALDGDGADHGVSQIAESATDRKRRPAADRGDGEERRVGSFQALYEPARRDATQSRTPPASRIQVRTALRLRVLNSDPSARGF